MATTEEFLAVVFRKLPEARREARDFKGAGIVGLTSNMDESDEATKRSWHFNQFKWALQALAISATDQRKLFPDWVAVADELALDFEHWASLVRGNYVEELSKDQVTTLDEIDRKLCAMSRGGPNSIRNCGRNRR